MTTSRTGASEIRTALRESRRLFASIALFSAFVNLLMLTGPLFMLQVYDRVLTSRSEATLMALIMIVAFLFLMMGLLDHLRARVLARAGARFQSRLDPRVLGAILTRAGHSPQARSAPATGLADLESMQRFASGPGPFAFFDAPWTPIFLFVLFAFHWLLGLLAVFSGILLMVLALLNQMRTARLQAEAGNASARAFVMTEQMRAGGETVRGPRDARRGDGASWRDTRRCALSHAGRLGPRRGLCSDLAHAASVPAVDDAGARGVARDPGCDHARYHDRGVDPARPRARADRPCGGAMAVASACASGRRAVARLLDETPEEPVRTPLPAPEPTTLQAKGWLS